MLFDIERGINGKATEQRLALRQELSAPVLADLKGWMQAERRKLSRHSPWPRRRITCSGAGTYIARFREDEPHLAYEQRSPKGHCAMSL